MPGAMWPGAMPGSTGQIDRGGRGRTKTIARSRIDRCCPCQRPPFPKSWSLNDLASVWNASQ
jgi:hypothetical protein